MLKTGRYSKDIPAQLAGRYQQSLSDPDLLSLNDDVALLRSILGQHLAEMGQGDPHPAWAEAFEAWQKLNKAINLGDPAALLAAKDELEAIIMPNYRAAIAENKVSQYIDQLGRITDKERRLLIDRQQVITVERMMLLIGAIASIVKEHVTDRKTLNSIQIDLQRLIPAGP